MSFGGLGSDEYRALIKAEVSPDFDMSRDISLVNNSTKLVEIFERGDARIFKYEGHH